jgi:hypothetical protein
LQKEKKKKERKKERKKEKMGEEGGDNVRERTFFKIHGKKSFRSLSADFVSTLFFFFPFLKVPSHP